MKKALRITGITLLVLLALAGALFVVAWKSPKYYEPKSVGVAPVVPFRTYTGEHPRPYIIRRENVVVFGAAHTRNPQDSELVEVRRCWKELRPTVALVEGRLGFLLPGVMDPVKELGEGGLVKQLASADGIPVYNWDMKKEALAAALAKQFSPAQVALAQVLSPWFSQQRFGRPSDEAAFLAPFFKRAAYVGMQDSLRTVADIDRTWKRYFPATDWRNVDDANGLPGFLGEMMAVSNDLRNQHLVAILSELRGRGERVFVICGSSHAFCVAPALSPATAALAQPTYFTYAKR
ncbi:MAG: hypothetical protein EOO16_09790 [Chitinophagaceae bacterium]|nr:MAG: hypothetical protein EOO16_09790 [Chitinophagaceae bacterium]